ncbi:Translation elongation factor G [Acidisarcina polymorpha]|uniref:Translation elongation factor G n=1 Tax=Acidisarcina polymorpha TaxID=2211140 RepID=A0A2Z5GAG1_9BACT|nr:Translation elongation factor G [Acidisarcina polymorpha]
MRGGILAGHEMVDIKVRLLDGSYHELDSNELAFRIAGSMALKEAARRAKPVVLEPVMSVEVSLPEVFAGEIIGDLNSRRGRIEGMKSESMKIEGMTSEGMEMVGGVLVIKAVAPLANMLGYGTALRGLSHGRANFSMAFKEYEARANGRNFNDDGPFAMPPVPKGPGDSPLGAMRQEADADA